MPVKRRGQLWGLCIGNNLALGKGTFGIALKRAQKAIEDGRYPLKEKEAMEEEVRGTMRKLKLFQEGGALHQELIEILLAYTAWSPEGRGYVCLFFFFLSANWLCSNTFLRATSS